MSKVSLVLYTLTRRNYMFTTWIISTLTFIAGLLIGRFSLRGRLQEAETKAGIRIPVRIGGPFGT